MTDTDLGPEPYPPYEFISPFWGDIVVSSMMYLLFPLIVPPLLAYGYAVNLGGSTARGEGTPDLLEGNVKNVLTLISLKLGFVVVLALPLWYIYVAMTSVLPLPTSVALFLSAAPLVYFNGALNAVYSAEGTADIGRISDLATSKTYLKYSVPYGIGLFLISALGYFFFEAGSFWILFLPVVFAYWTVSSFCYRGAVYRKAVIRGQLEAVGSVAEGTYDESETKTETPAENERSTDSVGFFIICPSCGTEVHRDASFCCLCGDELDRKDRMDRGIHVKKSECDECGSPVLSVDSYCQSCGTDLTDGVIKEGVIGGGKDVCDGCGEKLREGAFFCHNCGTDVSMSRGNTEGHDCGDCGEKTKRGASFCQTCGAEAT